MPEGDTIFRTARTLGKAIGGQTITSFRSRMPKLRDADLVGRRINTIEPRGKNLLIHFDDHRVLHTHMMMTGSWHIYRPGEPWQRPERQANLVIETGKFVAICFNAPVVQLLTPTQLRRSENLRQLGPDILKEDFNLDEAMQRLRARNSMEIGEALLAQRALAGIGNVYKCEALFLCHLNPFLKVSELSDEVLRGLILEARKWMKANLGGGMRTTRRALTGKRLWVYGRSGEECMRCGTVIRMKRQGRAMRSTYWCPKCQSTVAS
jgi:endonuclease-8